jgi:AhpD family alkylhydroperoxidase
MSMLDWNEHQKQALAGVAEIGRTSPGIVKGYVTLGGAAAKTGLLGSKAHELIALAVAVSVRRDGCIAVHTAAAIRAGATREEIAEASGTAAAVNAGAALVYATRVMDARAAKSA